MHSFLKSILIIIAFCAVEKSFAQEFETNMRKAYILLSIAQERDRQTAEILDEIKTKRIRVEEDLIDAQENPAVITKKDKEKLQNQLKTIKKQESEATKKRINAGLYLTEITDLIKGDPKKRSKYIADYEKKNGSLDNVVLINNQQDKIWNKPETDNITTDKIAELEKNNPPIDEKSSGSGDNKKDVPKSKKKTDKKTTEANTTTPIRKYDPKNDVMLNPPIANCVVSFDGTDEFTQKKKKEIALQPFFRHTEEFMKPAMKGKDYISCDISAARIQGGFYFLNLTFTILSKEAQKSFGFLDKGTLFVFKLINGEIISLSNVKTDIGVVDVINGTTVYKVTLQLNGAEARTLTSNELDIVRVAWSAGYEDYEIYNMDILMNIFKCLDKETK